MTNAGIITATLGSYGGAVTGFQPASANLTNWSGVGTNSILLTTNVVTSIVAGANASVTNCYKCQWYHLHHRFGFCTEFGGMAIGHIHRAVTFRNDLQWHMVVIVGGSSKFTQGLLQRQRVHRFNTDGHNYGIYLRRFGRCNRHKPYRCRDRFLRMKNIVKICLVIFGLASFCPKALAQTPIGIKQNTFTTNKDPSFVITNAISNLTYSSAILCGIGWRGIRGKWKLLF